MALRQTTRRSGFSAGEGAAANGSLTERRSSRQSANYVDGETERRSAMTDATTDGNGNDGRQQRTAATADERLTVRQNCALRNRSCGKIQILFQ